MSIVKQIRDDLKNGVLIGPVTWAKLLDYAEELEKDSARLWFACIFDGYSTVEEDRYDFAEYCAHENGRDEPNKEDELNGLRRLIDAAMEAESAEVVAECLSMNGGE